jgi:hypothetical protein
MIERGASRVVALVPVLLVLGCSSSSGRDSREAAQLPDAGALGEAAAAPAGSPGDAASGTAEGGVADDADAALATVAMREISGGAPALASSNQASASMANDNDPLTSWTPTALPAWIAYDLSAAPSVERQGTLVVWNALHAGSYINASPPSGASMPTAYTIEINGAPGATAAPPADGWTQVAAVTGNLRNTVETPISMNGANWLRMSVTASTDATVSIDVDVFSAPHGATDTWLFTGDSITYITMPYAWNDVPKLVNTARMDRRPALINAAIGGTNTSTATGVIDDTMTGFPGRYVVLAYGTNDNVSQGATFEMETLVQDVIAAGKVPVVPHMPWSDTAAVQANGPIINQAIDALYAKYPQILRGPDLWTAFTGRTDLIPSGDVHPNSQGQEFLRQQWADVMAAVP